MFSGFPKQVANPIFQGSSGGPACLILINFLAILDPKNRPFGVQNDPPLGVALGPATGLPEFSGQRGLYLSVLGGVGVWGGQGAGLC